MKRLIGVSVVVALIIIGFLMVKKIVIPNKQRQIEHKPLTVKVEEITLKRIDKTAITYGKLIAPKSVNLKAQSDGEIKAVFFKEGEKVKKGQILFELKSNDISQPLNTLKASLEIAKERYLRSQKLYQEFSGGISEIDLLNNKSKYQQALAQYNEAKAIHDITSPINGMVEKTDLAVGDMVLSGDLLVKISNKNQLQIDYQLPLNQAQQAKIGQKVQFIANGQIVNGVVSYIAYEISSGNLLTLRANISNDKNKKLFANTYGKVIQTLKKDMTVILVNQNLIQTDSSGFYVFLDKDNHVIKQKIKVGELMKNGQIEITSGLKVNDKLIMSHLDSLSDGQSVTAII